MKNFVQFDVKKFSSGEWDIKIKERIYGDAIIHWNWFNENERDIMLLLMKIGAIKKQYGMIPITIHAPYLPYARQDRVFEAGQDLAIETLVKAICGRYSDVKIETMALHCKRYNCNSYDLKYEIHDETHAIYNIIYPDSNAIHHYSHLFGNHERCLHFEKIRDKKDKPSLKLITDKLTLGELGNNYFLICDDICAGGRTFIECAKEIRRIYGNDTIIELMIYHAFLDHGLDALKESGISQIHIINPDSYEYICKLYPNDLEYFNYKELN